MHLYFHLCGSVVVHFPCLDLSLLDGFEDGVDEGGCGLAVWYLADYESLVVKLLYLCPYLELSAALSVVVFAHVDASSRGEIRIELEFFAMQVFHGGIAYIIEVMRKNL